MVVEMILPVCVRPDSLWYERARSFFYARHLLFRLFKSMYRSSLGERSVEWGYFPKVVL